MDLSDLLATLDDGSDAGEDMEYEPIFTELELVAKPGEERVMGDSVQEAEEPNWRDVKEKALAVLEQSKDLRASMHLAQAGLKTGGFPDFATVMTYVKRCLTEHWDGVHPMLDADDDDDPTMRVNAVLTLADGDGILRAVRNAPLTQSRAFGGFSLFDVEIAEGEIEVPESLDTVPDRSQISAAFQDTEAEWLTATKEAVNTALDDLVAIDGKFDEETPGRGPNLDDLLRALRRIKARIDEATGSDEEFAEGDADGEEGAAGGGAGGGPVRRGVGEITTRADVQKAIDKIIDYYAKNEPSSPVPIILKRARRLVDADFMKIMEDIAPDGLENVRVVVGRSDEEEEEEEY
ncbi:MAG: type VI secretion system protein TssA [Pseudomonadota bacterium]